MLSSLLEQERSLGELDSQGEFTLSLEDAGAKLARYQASDRLFIVLKLVQAAVAGGATSITIRGGRFEAARARVDLAALRTRLVQSRLEVPDSPEAHLAAALLAHGPRFRVTSGSLCLEGESLRTSPGGTGLVVELDSLFVYGLADRVGFAPLPIRCRGRLLNYQPPATHRCVVPGDGVAWAGPYQSGGPGVPLRCGAFSLPFAPGLFQRSERPVPVGWAVLLLEDIKEPSRVVLVKRGVTLQTEARLAIPGCRCIVSAEGLPTDLSGLRAIDGPDLQALRGRLTSEVLDFYRGLVRTVREPIRWLWMAAILVCGLGGITPSGVDEPSLKARLGHILSEDWSC